MKAATAVGTFPTGSPEWHAARAGKVTGSKIAVIMGISPYESLFSLWHREKGLVAEVEVSAPMEWGNRLEPIVMKKFEEEHPELANIGSATWQNLERPYQLSNPDGLFLTSAGDHVLLEVKTAKYDDHWGEPGTDQIPVWYRAQVLWYLDTLGLDVAHIAVLIGGSDYREYKIVRDAVADADIRLMRECAADFILSLENDEQPDIDGSTSTYDTIKELHPDIHAETVVVPDEMAQELILAKIHSEAATNILTEAKSRLADFMGNAHYAEWRGRRIADRRVRKAPGSIPYMQLANTLPDPESRAA